jgi:hypothetical protein
MKLMVLPHCIVLMGGWVDSGLEGTINITVGNLHLNPYYAEPEVVPACLIDKRKTCDDYAASHPLDHQRQQLMNTNNDYDGNHNIIWSTTRRMTQPQVPWPPLAKMSSSRLPSSSFHDSTIAGGCILV